MKKNINRFALSLILILALTITAFANDFTVLVDDQNQGGQVTINGTAEANDNINIIIENGNKRYFLDSFFADSNGEYQINLTLPQNMKFDYVVTSGQNVKTGIIDTTYIDSGTTTPSDKNIKISLAIDLKTIDKGYILNKSNISVKGGDTVLNATSDILDAEGIDYEHSRGYMSSIDGIGEFDYGSGSGWQYKVNGEYPQVGADKYKLSQGDKIEWRYTTQLGDDIGGGNSASGSGGTLTGGNLEGTVFEDVEKDAWYAQSVEYCVEKKLFKGVSDTHFAPMQLATRATIWNVLARMNNVDTEGGETWYSKALAWVLENNISDGLRMDAQITRIELVTMLYRLEGKPQIKESANLESFYDVGSVADWGKHAMTWAVSQDIIKGSGGNLNPNDYATRAEVAAIFERFTK